MIEYRVCLSQGCFSSDSVNAVEQSILDGVNVINFSISGGADPYTDPVELAFLDAFHAGISVNAAAGNDGPAPGTVDHGGPWVTSVGAVTGPRSFSSTLQLTADGGATYSQPGITLTNGVSTATPVVLAQSLPGEDVLCQSKLAAGAATGKIVMCERGTNARIDKGFNVLAGGAAGMILYNPIQMDTESDNHWLPAIHLDGPDDALLAFVNSHTGVKASWAAGSRDTGNARCDGGLLFPRAAVGLHQAGPRRPGRPGPRGNDTPARRDDADERAARATTSRRSRARRWRARTPPESRP